jgi:hypothetical protein
MERFPEKIENVLKRVYKAMKLYEIILKDCSEPRQ